MWKSCMLLSLRCRKENTQYLQMQHAFCLDIVGASEPTQGRHQKRVVLVPRVQVYIHDGSAAVLVVTVGSVQRQPGHAALHHLYVHGHAGIVAHLKQPQARDSKQRWMNGTGLLPVPLSPIRKVQARRHLHRNTRTTHLDSGSCWMAWLVVRQSLFRKSWVKAPT